MSKSGGGTRLHRATMPWCLNQTAAAYNQYAPTLAGPSNNNVSNRDQPAARQQRSLARHLDLETTNPTHTGVILSGSQDLRLSMFYSVLRHRLRCCDHQESAEGHVAWQIHSSRETEFAFQMTSCGRKVQQDESPHRQTKSQKYPAHGTLDLPGRRKARLEQTLSIGSGSTRRSTIPKARVHL